MIDTEHDLSTPTGARNALREIFPPDATITTMITHRSTRSSVVAVTILTVVDGQPYNISWLVARAMRMSLHGKVAGVKISCVGARADYTIAHKLMGILHGLARANQFTLNNIG